MLANNIWIAAIKETGKLAGKLYKTIGKKALLVFVYTYLVKLEQKCVLCLLFYQPLEPRRADHTLQRKRVEFCK